MLIKFFFVKTVNFFLLFFRIAKSQQYDSDGLVDIFRQYGDHLYSKGDLAGNIKSTSWKMRQEHNALFISDLVPVVSSFNLVYYA